MGGRRITRIRFPKLQHDFLRKIDLVRLASAIAGRNFADNSAMLFNQLEKSLLNVNRERHGF